MQFLQSLFPAPSRYPRPSLETRLAGPRVVLRMGEPSDWHNWKMLRELSRDFLTPWEPKWSPRALTYGFYCGVLRRHWRDWRRGTNYNFHIFLRPNSGKGTGALIGGIALNDIQRGIAQKGTMGYWLGQPYTGQGYMQEAAALVCDFAFSALRLHRVEASCLPHNEPSKNILRRLGFEEEGYARAYLEIDGRWQDHLLWGRTAPSPATG